MCNKIDDTTDNFNADLKNQLRKSKMDLMVANEKIALYDDKIKDKNDIIEALKMTNSLLKSENKDKIDTQAVAIRKLQEELSQKNKEKFGVDQQGLKTLKERTDEISKNAIIEKLHRNNDSLEIKLKSYQIKEEDNKKLIATLEAQIKAKDDQISLLELGQNLDTCKIKEKDDLLKDQAAIIKEMEIKMKSWRRLP